MNAIDRQRTSPEDIAVLTSGPDGTRPQTLGVVCGNGQSLSARTAFEHAMNDLRRQAHLLAADAVVSVSVSHAFAEETQYSAARFSVMLVGTAVVLPWPDGHGDPTLTLPAS